MFRIIHTIYELNPLSGTYSDYILLKNYYKTLEDSMEMTSWKLIIFNNQNFLLKQQIYNNWNLVCAYCGKKNLIIQPIGLKLDQSIIATVDHFYPKKHYENRSDEDNMVVSCYRCNNNKGEKLYNIETLIYINDDKKNIIKNLKIK